MDKASKFPCCKPLKIYTSFRVSPFTLKVTSGFILSALYFPLLFLVDNQHVSFVSCRVDCVFINMFFTFCFFILRDIHIIINVFYIKTGKWKGTPHWNGMCVSSVWLGTGIYFHVAFISFFFSFYAQGIL